MTKLPTEDIKLKFRYKSQHNNGWPLIAILINDQILTTFEANENVYEVTHSFYPKGVNTLKLHHFGKNYFTDGNPDKFFQLEQAWINDVDLKHHIHKFKQTALLPPWDTVAPPEHSLYLGHNGFLSLNFSSPVNTWIQDLFGVNQDTMHGQQTTRQVLDQVKGYFDL